MCLQINRMAILSIYLIEYEKERESERMLAIEHHTLKFHWMEHSFIIKRGKIQAIFLIVMLVVVVMLFDVIYMICVCA